MQPPARPGQRRRRRLRRPTSAKIGLATCYDAKFPEVFQRLRDKGAELVVWTSAYSGFTELQAFALLHHYAIVTSTLTGDSLAYDITGRPAARPEGPGRRDGVPRSRWTWTGRSTTTTSTSTSATGCCASTPRDVRLDVDMPREEWFVLAAKRPGVSAAAARPRVRPRGAAGLQGPQPRRDRRAPRLLLQPEVRRLPGAGAPTAARGSGDAMSTPARSPGRAARRARRGRWRSPARAGDEAIRLPAHGRALRPRQGLRRGGARTRTTGTRRRRRSRPSRTSSTASASTGASTPPRSRAASRGRSSTCRTRGSRSTRRRTRPGIRRGFDAEEWMRLFKDNGLRMFAFTSKHHDGFSMFDTRTRVEAAGELDGRRAARGSRTATSPTASRRRRSGATSSGSCATPRTGTASRSTSTSRTPTGTTRTSGPTASRRSRRRAPRSTRSSTAARPSPRGPATSSSPPPSPRPRSRPG